MKLLLTMLCLVISTLSFGQACPYITTFTTLTSNSDSRVAYKVVNPSNGNKWLRIIIKNGTDTYIDTCLDVSGNIGVEIADTTSWFKAKPNTIIEFRGYTGNNCGGTYCWTSTAPLPITLSAFDVSSNNGVAHISWRVASKENFNRFEVERSSDGEVYNLIHTVFDSKNDYYTVDDYIIYSKAYYRLKLVDNDGSNTYSPVRVIMSNSVNKQPFRGFINGVPIASQVNNNINVKVCIRNITGIVVYTTNIHNGEQILVPELSHGIYIVEVDDNKYKLIL